LQKQKKQKKDESLNEEFEEKYQKIEEDNIRTSAHNFARQMMLGTNKDNISGLIHRNNIEAEVEIGSIVLYGKDVEKLVDLLIEKMNEYIKDLNEEDIYKKTFTKLFRENKQDHIT